MLDLLSGRKTLWLSAASRCQKRRVFGPTPLFFFSSRRRHTRYWRDWSSDVCSSDLTIAVAVGMAEGPEAALAIVECLTCEPVRSEERRVGKECRSRWSADH